ncbi:class I SAM-dependent methyltransferase, partial [Pseudomonas yamanorum]|nr:SAM-dependent methyltransferase [Pseudomonas yamanorum]
MNCRGCGTPLVLPLIDLGTSPPSNAYLRADQLEQAEPWLPLKVAVCQSCWLVQT